MWVLGKIFLLGAGVYGGVALIVSVFNVIRLPDDPVAIAVRQGLSLTGRSFAVGLLVAGGILMPLGAAFALTIFKDAYALRDDQHLAKRILILPLLSLVILGALFWRCL